MRVHLIQTFFDIMTLSFNARRREISVHLYQGQLFELTFLYKFQQKNSSFRLCYTVDSIIKGDAEEETFETSLSNLGFILQKILLENGLLQYVEASFMVLQMTLRLQHKGLTEKFQYHLSPYGQGLAIKTRSSTLGTYRCRIYTENPSRTYVIRINGFCVDRNLGVLLSDVFIPEKILALLFPDKTEVHLTFYGITLAKEITPMEIVENVMPYETS